MVTNEDLINELKLRPQIGNSLLVKKFYKPMVITVSKRYKLDKLDSEAVVNKSLLKVINQIKTYKYESEKKFFNWLYTIILNNVRDFLEKKKKEQERINTVSRDERILPEESMQDKFYDADIFNSDISYIQEEKNTADNDVDEIIDTNTAREYFISYSKSSDSKVNKRMEQVIEILSEFTLEEQCCITMRADNISMKEIARIRKSNETATKKYVSRLMIKFFKKVGEKLKINNHKELYENFKRQDKLSNPSSDIKEEAAKS